MPYLTIWSTKCKEAVLSNYLEVIFLTKIRAISLLSIVAISVALFGCENHNANKKVAERYAISHYASFGRLYSVEETVYDKETDRYIVSIKENENRKTVVVGFTDGVISSIDYDDGKGETAVSHVSTTVTEVEPGHTVIEFK